MIRYAEPERLLDFLERDALGIKIAGCALAYGVQPFSEYWLQTDESGQISAAISRLDSALTLCTHTSLYEHNELCDELEAFCHMLPGLRSVLMDKRLPIRLHTTREGICMELHTVPKAEIGSHCRIPRLSALYELVMVCGDSEFEPPSYEAFAVDMSHRFRHGVARCWGIYGGERLDAAVFTTAETLRHALIGGVFTRPDLRGRGMAGRLLREACHMLTAEGKTPLLFCLPALRTFYERLGFCATGQWMEAALTNQT